MSRASLAPPPGPIVAGQPVPVAAHPDPLSLIENDDPQLAANKRLVHDLWRTVLNAGHLEVADRLVAEDYIQHSPVLLSGREAFKATFSVIPRRDEIPEVMTPRPVAFVAEGDLVAMALVEDLPESDGSGTYTSTHFNMFRVENGRVVEHWHAEQGAPCPDLPSAEEGGPQPITGAVGTAQYALLESADPQLAANKRLVFDVWRQVVDAGREEVADLYLTPDYIQHNPNAATGREGFKAYFATRPDQPIETSLRDSVVATLAEGDLVVQVLRLELPNPYAEGETYTTAWFDMFRIEDGRLAEHWDAARKPGTVVEEFGVSCEVPAPG
jgi:predicted SnoaL-like aldol condensation-catalyzing enzyme